MIKQPEPKPKMCDSCKGAGQISVCDNCMGRGMVYLAECAKRVKCRVCRGKGSVPRRCCKPYDRTCEACAGSGVRTA